MATNTDIAVFDIVGNKACVAVSDGEKVYERAFVVLNRNEHVTLSFLNVELITSAFINTAIGRLYGEFSSELMSRQLGLKNLPPNYLPLFLSVLESAQMYYYEPEKFVQAVKDDGYKDQENV